MPKKHTPSFAHTKPSYVHPSLSRSSTPSGPASPQTVNERIQQLRREQTPRATIEQRDAITEVATHRTIPPALRRILHMTEVDAPAPKPGSRRNVRTDLRPGARPPPGPAAPSSWLHQSRYAPKNIRKYMQGEGYGPQSFCKLAKVHDADFKRLPPSRSLLHQCLRTFAANWDDLVEFEQHYLPALPVPLKEALLSYLSIYGIKGGLDLRSLKILFGKDGEIDGGSGSEEIQFLDLTGLLGDKYTLRDLEKSLIRSTSSTKLTTDLAGLSLDSPKGKAKAPVEVAESWEDDADDDDTSASALPSTLSVPLFPNLTRLSLAHPGTFASWSDLLALSPKLNKLTHLSLAYWPTPSMTPNAVVSSMVSKHTRPVALGGTHFYSELDDDWEEAANILRRLALNTYCLRWLDLEGCRWHKALAWDRRENLDFNTDFNAMHTAAVVGWVNASSSPGPDFAQYFASSWRQIEYLNLFQGWIPSDLHALRAMPAGAIQVQLLSWLREHGDDEENQEKLRPDVGYAVTEWVEREKVARSVGKSVATSRKLGQGKWCTVDYGWHGITSTLKVRGGEEL